MYAVMFRMPSRGSMEFMLIGRKAVYNKHFEPEIISYRVSKNDNCPWAGKLFFLSLDGF